jgi:hypothetical protein
MKKFIASICLFTTASCAGPMHSISMEFKPHTYKYKEYGPVVKLAKLMYEDDQEEVAECDQLLLGELDLAGNLYKTEDELLYRAQVESAARGATHTFVISSENNHVHVGLVRVRDNDCLYNTIKEMK